MQFKPVFIEGTTLNDTWFQLLYALQKSGRIYPITKGSYEGANRLAFDDVSGFIHRPHERPLAPIMPEASNLPTPTTEQDIEQYFAEYLMNPAMAVNEDYRYSLWICGGEYKMPHLEIQAPTPAHWGLLDEAVINVPNQIEWIIKHFKSGGHGNEHCYLTVGYPESNFAYDVPYSNPNERRTSPCLRGLDFRIVDGALLTKVIYRSWDLWGGWPTNMGGFTLLNEYVANELGIDPGPLSFVCKSLHCYDFQLGVLAARTGQEERKIV